ncbi:hypothetical protein [Sphingomonas soli]|uniref:hypothetical protein n=1 Tax=Sphingomonas soli TaxID=266127 RepID=UPI000A8D0BA5|nr:hypothetical protein [Sphingomonas soli]
MQLLPMDAPAELHRWAPRAGDVLVASGPLIIMAHGLLAIPPADRRACWITTASGDLSADDAEEALRAWSKRH